MLNLPTTDPKQNLKLNLALLRISQDGDFGIIANWLLQEKARLARLNQATEGAVCYRIQGALQVLTDLSDYVNSARQTIDKLQEGPV